MTKIELEQINARLAEENAALRAENSALSVSLKAAQSIPKAATRKEYVAPEEKVSEYEDFKAAQQRCKELIAWDRERKYNFVQRGNRVICKVR